MPAKPIHIGTTLKRFRMMKQKSQEELALDSSLERKYIGSLELNLQQPSLGTVFAIAAALGIKASEFIEAVEEDLKKKQDKE